MQPSYFRVNNNEYCHITDETIFITNSKDVVRIPPEHTLNESWGIKSIFNYIVFAMVFLYVSYWVTDLGMDFFLKPINYGALFLLFYIFINIKNGFITSETPTIKRNKIKNCYFKTPFFSYPQLVIYFEGPEGKILRRTISALYKKEALPIVTNAGLIKTA